MRKKPKSTVNVLSFQSCQENKSLNTINKLIDAATLFLKKKEVWSWKDHLQPSLSIFNFNISDLNFRYTYRLTTYLYVFPMHGAVQGSWKHTPSNFQYKRYDAFFKTPEYWFIHTMHWLRNDAVIWFSFSHILTDLNRRGELMDFKKLKNISNPSTCRSLVLFSVFSWPRSFKIEMN